MILDNNTAEVLNTSISSYANSIEIEFLTTHNKTKIFKISALNDLNLNIDPIMEKNLKILVDVEK
jgi:hypothetical protein